MGIARLMGGEAVFYLSGRDFWDAIFFLVIEFLHGFLLTGGIIENDENNLSISKFYQS